VFYIHYLRQTKKEVSTVFQTRADTKGCALTAVERTAVAVLETVNGRSLLSPLCCQQTLSVPPAPADSLQGDGANATRQEEFYGFLLY